MNSRSAVRTDVKRDHMSLFTQSAPHGDQACSQSKGSGIPFSHQGWSVVLVVLGVLGPVTEHSLASGREACE